MFVIENRLWACQRAPSLVLRRLLNSLPDNAIGSQRAIEQKKLHFEEKYRALLENAAKQKGISFEQLKQQNRAKARPAQCLPTSSQLSTDIPLDPAKSKARSPAVNKSGLPSLDSIIDLKKLFSRQPPISADEISTLWKGYHASSTASSRLGAVLPLKTYKRMLQRAEAYPDFVLALPREVESGERGAETIYMQWAMFPTTESSISSSTVIFTSLANYKAHGTFAQPSLCLTHYADLADSHGLVLMRGDITTSAESGQQSMATNDAHLLCLRLQQYYNSTDSSAEQLLLSSFHSKNGPAFDMQQVVDKAWQG